tara:strand:+ start:274 stop:840 length:567 start_codon:yes stop_codon:yes gene_type:complete
MQRNSFIVALSALTTLPLLSFSSIEDVIGRKVKGFKVKAGEGRIHGHITLKGVNSNILDVKISGSDTDKDLAIFEQTSLTPGKGTPLHVHHFQDEMFYVLEGTYYFKVGEETFDLNVGDSIFLPKKVPHAWTQVSERGKMLVIFQPAGKMENFFVAVSQLDHEPSPKEMEHLFADNEMKIVGPPLKIK